MTRDIDWNRTIAANLSPYVPEHRAVIPERLVGYDRRQVIARDVVLVIGQSGSKVRRLLLDQLALAIDQYERTWAHAKVAAS